MRECWPFINDSQLRVSSAFVVEASLDMEDIPLPGSRLPPPFDRMAALTQDDFKELLQEILQEIHQLKVCEFHLFSDSRLTVAVGSHPVPNQILHFCSTSECVFIDLAQSDTTSHCSALAGYTCPYCDNAGTAARKVSRYGWSVFCRLGGYSEILPTSNRLY